MRSRLDLKLSPYVFVAPFFLLFAVFGAFPLIAIVVLHRGPADISLLAAAGPAVGALAAIPFGPWVEFSRKRRMMAP